MRAGIVQSRDNSSNSTNSYSEIFGLTLLLSVDRGQAEVCKTNLNLHAVIATV